MKLYRDTLVAHDVDTFADITADANVWVPLAEIEEIMRTREPSRVLITGADLVVSLNWDDGYVEASAYVPEPGHTGHWEPGFKP